MKGSIQRAKTKTQWLGLIFFIPFFVHFYLKSAEVKDYWMWVCLSGVISLWMFTHFTKMAWKNIQERHISVLVNKTMNYHLICMTSLLKVDYNYVKFVLDTCLDKYDPKSQLTFFIRGALAVGTDDSRPFKEFIKQIELIKV